LDTQGKHLLVEFWGCNPSALDDITYLETQLRRAAKEACTTIVGVCLHQFSPTGVSGVVVIQESHLSIHTWPEVGYAAVDCYTCGEGDPWKAYLVLRGALQSTRVETIQIERGLGLSVPCKIQQHTWSVPQHAICTEVLSTS
jgi:S-adenosylmethionine decarboxylase proenzyme